jgi:hypothetical protein
MSKVITYNNGAGTKLADFLSDVRSNISSGRNDYLDLREAAVTTKRLEYAVKDLARGDLYRYDAENLVEKADEAIGNYDYSSEIGDAWRVIPRFTRWIMLLTFIGLELLAACFALDKVWTTFWIENDALNILISIGVFAIVAIPLDLLGLYAVMKGSVFFIEMRKARLEGYRDTLKNFIDHN